MLRISSIGPQSGHSGAMLDQRVNGSQPMSDVMPMSCIQLYTTESHGAMSLAPSLLNAQPTWTQEHRVSVV
jgi:hypothetical protein